MKSQALRLSYLSARHDLSPRNGQSRTQGTVEGVPQGKIMLGAKKPAAFVAPPHNKLAGTEGVVAVLDAGGQYVDLVKKACDRLGYPAAVLPLDTPAETLKKNYQALIISGSPASSQEVDAPMPDPAIWQLKMPILGICYGLHAMATVFGGEVVRGTSRQDGRVTTNVDVAHPLFNGTKASFSALFTHGNFVSKVPESFKTIGQHKLSNGTIVYSAIARDNIVAVQFHPEVFDDTPEGYQVFKNFLEDIAKLQPDQTFLDRQMDELIKRLRKDIRRQVADRHVIAFVSGGVDSSVAATLAASELPGERMHAYYIDNGLMRDEDETVIKLLRHLGVPVEKVDATKDFLTPLQDVTDPQTKRQIIGKVFIDVQDHLLGGLGLTEALLLQGTNAADRIESGYSKGGSHTALIKTHHNQVKEVQDLKARGLLIEPLDELFKDEVRAVGKHLGLPEEVVQRQPFPGPGLAVRILCTKTDELSADATETEKSIQDYLDNKNLDGTVFAKVLPVRNVGVGGDERSHVAAVALQTFLAWNTLAQLARELPATFRDDINRVIIALGPYSISKLQVTPTLLQPSTIEQLRHADRIVWEEMRAHDVIKTISQFPVVLLPLSFNKPGERSIVLRPVTTSTFMTVQPMVPERDIALDFIQRSANRILTEVPGISQVFLDLTSKPPATTEWE